MRDETTNEFYKPLSSPIVLKRTTEMLYVHLNFENGLTIDALVDSRAYVIATAHSDLDRIKQKAIANIFKSGDRPTFQIQVANCELEKPKATTTVKFVIEDHTSAEQFIVTKKCIGPIIGSHFMRHNSVVIDSTHGLIQFSHFTMHLENTANGVRSKPQVVLFNDALSIPLMTTKPFTAFVDHPSEWNTTRTWNHWESLEKQRVC